MYIDIDIVCIITLAFF